MEIKWNESFSVFNHDLDSQHQRLFEMLNSFQEEMKHNPDNKKSFQKIIHGLKEYTLVHFTAEEKHMILMNYPYLEVHQSKHIQFIDKIDEYDSRIKTGENVLPFEIITFLKEWLTRHIYVEDKQYANYKLSKI